MAEREGRRQGRGKRSQQMQQKPRLAEGVVISLPVVRAEQTFGVFSPKDILVPPQSA